MTNTELLRSKLDKSGYKLRFVARKIGLSYQGFLNKVENKSAFNATEIFGLCQLLDVSLEEKEQIFFASEVDK